MTIEISSGGAHPERLVMLPSGHVVPREFHDGVRGQIEDIIPAMQPGVSYTVAQMCGLEFWGPLFDLERQDAGRCVIWMVIAGALPLRLVGCPHAQPKRYERI